MHVWQVSVDNARALISNLKSLSSSRANPVHSAPALVNLAKQQTTLTRSCYFETLERAICHMSFKDGTATSYRYNAQLLEGQNFTLLMGASKTFENILMVEVCLRCCFAWKFERESAKYRSIIPLFDSFFSEGIQKFSPKMNNGWVLSILPEFKIGLFFADLHVSKREKAMKSSLGRA